MPRKKKFVDTLSKSEISTLEQGQKHGKSPDFRQRCQILLISNRGHSVKQISNVLNVNPQTVYTTIQAWEEKGFAGIQRKKGQGRKPILEIDNPKHVRAAIRAVEKHSEDPSLILKDLRTELDLKECSQKSLVRFLEKLADTDENYIWRKKRS